MIPLNAIILITAVTLTLPVTLAAAADGYTYYANRWMVSEVPPNVVKPPFTLLWEKSPILFESLNPAGLSESASRRIALTEHGFVSVMRKTLYLLDKNNGEILWTRALPGNDITDWKVTGSLFLYTSVDYETNELIRGVIDVAERKENWIQKDPRPKLYQMESLMPSEVGLVIYFSNGGNKGINDAIVAIDLKTGDVKWRSSTDAERASVVSFSWFILGDRLCVLVAPTSGGLYLKTFDLIDGKALATNHIFGTDRLGNLPHPAVVTPDGIVFIGYNKRLTPSALSLLSYDTKTNKLLWSRDISIADQKDLTYFRHILHSAGTNLMVATVWPNRFIVFDSEKGTILKDARLSDYVGWTDRNTSLYSYPYLFTGARRTKGQSMAFDLIALNLETGKADWSYEMETQNRNFTFPVGDTLNFVIKDDQVYIGRSDAKIMSFRHK